MICCIKSVAPLQESAATVTVAGTVAGMVAGTGVSGAGTVAVETAMAMPAGSAEVVVLERATCEGDGTTGAPAIGPTIAALFGRCSVQ